MSPKAATALRGAAPTRDLRARGHRAFAALAIDGAGGRADAGAAGARASLLHVDDLAQAAVKLLDSPAQGTYELHDGHDAGYSWEEIATIVEGAAGRGRGWRLKLPEGVLRSVATMNLLAARLFGYLPMMTPGKINELRHPDWVCDNTEITLATGWQPHISLQDGLSPLLPGRAVRPL